MRKINKHFLQILEVEMEDLQEDLNDMISLGRDQLNSGEITERVYMSNTSLFQNEKSGINEFMHIIKTTIPDNFDSLEELISYLKKELETLIKGEGIAPAIEIFIERKMLKVTKYVSR